MRVAIDIDGCIADFSLSYTKLAYNIGVSDWYWRTEQQVVYDYPFDMSLVWSVVKSTNNWWMNLESLVSEEEIQLLNKIISEHDIYFITARKRTKGLSAELQTRLWLNSIGVNADKASVIATQDGKKGILCKALDIDIALDDRPDGVLEILEQGVQCYVRRWKFNDGNVLFDYVDNLGEFLEKIIDKR